MKNKKTQRIEANNLRLDIKKELYQAYSDAICKKVMELKQYKDTKTVMIYCPKDRETDTSLLLNDCIKNKKLILPKTNVELKTISPYYVNKLSDLEMGAYEILEPKETCKEAMYSDIDIIVVPMVAFDKSGTRLGYGGGYYDRFLPKAASAYKVGIAFSVQEMEMINTEEHDIKMDAIITEKQVFNF